MHARFTDVELMLGGRDTERKRWKKPTWIEMRIRTGNKNRYKQLWLCYACSLISKTGVITENNIKNISKVSVQSQLCIWDYN